MVRPSLFATMRSGPGSIKTLLRGPGLSFATISAGPGSVAMRLLEVFDGLGSLSRYQIFTGMLRSCNPQAGCTV